MKAAAEIKQTNKPTPATRVEQFSTRATRPPRRSQRVLVSGLKRCWRRLTEGPDRDAGAGDTTPLLHCCAEKWKGPCRQSASSIFLLRRRLHCLLYDTSDMCFSLIVTQFNTWWYSCDGGLLPAVHVCCRLCIHFQQRLPAGERCRHVCCYWLP